MSKLSILAWATAGALAIIGLTAGRSHVTAGSGREPPPDRNRFMKMKLQSAQLVLDGIAVGDCQRIEEGASYLVRLSKKAEFQLGGIPNYERYSDEFRRSAEALVKAAQAKNLDAATLAYVDLTLNCVKCHKHIREVK